MHVIMLVGKYDCFPLKDAGKLTPSWATDVRELFTAGRILYYVSVNVTHVLNFY